MTRYWGRPSKSFKSRQIWNGPRPTPSRTTGSVVTLSVPSALRYSSSPNSPCSATISRKISVSLGSGASSVGSLSAEIAREVLLCNSCSSPTRRLWSRDAANVQPRWFALDNRSLSRSTRSYWSSGIEAAAFVRPSISHCRTRLAALSARRCCWFMNASSFKRGGLAVDPASPPQPVNAR